uniref:KID domain-containing protein n=1 Tax=Spermophilus dauricus TaxID=99837 RepID=A0A8C9QD20_SPEDA
YEKVYADAVLSGLVTAATTNNWEIFLHVPLAISTIAESEDSQESVDSVTDSQKRREILSRRPSYRKILNDLSSDAPGVPRIEEEKSEEETSAPAITTVTVPTPIYQTSSGQCSYYSSILILYLTFHI